MLINSCSHKVRYILLLAILVLAGSSKANAQPMVRLSGYVPVSALHAVPVGPLSTTTSISIDITLPLTNAAALKTLLAEIYSRHNPQYLHFLSHAKFISEFGPTVAEETTVTTWLKSQGLTVNKVSGDRMVIEASGTAKRIETAFSVSLNTFKLPSGKIGYAPNIEPLVPTTFASCITAITGLNTLTSRSPSVYLKKNSRIVSHGSGPDGGLTPFDINSAYNLYFNSASPQLNGAGQEIALIETDGFSPEDIQLYQQQFNLPATNVTAELIDGSTGLPGPGTLEAETDIELALAVAPNANIVVYETPATDQGIIDALDAVSNDNAASVVEIGAGAPELTVLVSTLAGENALFSKLAAQGVTVLAAAGDNGAYANGNYDFGPLGPPTVDDPGSQPNVTTVGGTSLSVGNLSAYLSETSWSNQALGSGGGGGFSAIWPIPSYQAAAIDAANEGSPTKRNLPDISVEADPLYGYSLSYQGSFAGPVGGTGAAASVWAGIAALINQERARFNVSPANIGFLAPTIYNLMVSSPSHYANDFHDIADKSTNLLYPAVTGFDNSTGWGSPNGINLITDLAGVLPVPNTPTSLAATPANASVKLTWAATPDATTYTVLDSRSPTGPFLNAGTTANAFGTINGLANGIVYYFEVYASSNSGNSLPTAPVECVPAGSMLAITVGPNVVINDDGSATVNWVTNVPSTSLVSFGMDGAPLTSTVSNATYAVAHSLIIPAVMCGDLTAFIATSTDGTATVSSAPQVYTPL